MYTVLLYLHIITISIALTGVILMTLFTLVGKYSPKVLRSTLLALVFIGIGAGGVLLLFVPSPATCVKLAVYLVAFGALYVLNEKRSQALASELDSQR